MGVNAGISVRSTWLEAQRNLVGKGEYSGAGLDVMVILYEE